MDNLSNLVYIGIPALGLLALGAICWLRSVFKEVSLSDDFSTDLKTATAERRAEGFEFQLSIAEDLGVEPATLNALSDAVLLAHDDVQGAKEDAERARQVEARRQTAHMPDAREWFSPVAAVHGINRQKPGE